MTTIFPAHIPGPTPRSWAARHWVLLIILGVVLIVLMAGGGVTWFVFQIFAMMRNHPAAQQGVAIAQVDPQVIAAIGQPITLRPVVGGNVGLRNGVQVADLQLKLHGPNGEGTLWLRATGSGTTWNFDRLEFSPNGGRMFEVARPPVTQTPPGLPTAPGPD